MISYVFDIGDRARKVSRFIAHVRSELQRALIEEKSARKITQQSIAEKIGVNRSVINRQFKGEENLTLRSIAELAWALDWEPQFQLKKTEVRSGDNYRDYFRGMEIFQSNLVTSSLSEPNFVRIVSFGPQLDENPVEPLANNSPTTAMAVTSQFEMAR